MPSRHFLIDASALTPLFILRKGKPGDIKVRAAMLKLIMLRNDGKASLFIPSFCMAECAKAFAREQGLSGLDALIVAMGRVHASANGHDNVWIVTADEWLAR